MNQSRNREFFPANSFCRAVRDAFGDDLLHRLRGALGGEDVRFPVSTAVLLDGHWLVRAVGREDAERLCHLFSDECIYIPKLSVEERYLSLVKEGLSAKEVARRLDRSERHVRRLAAALGVRAEVTGPRARMAVRPAALARKSGIPALVAAE